MRSVLGRPERVLGVGITWKILENYGVRKRLSTGVLRGRAVRLRSHGGGRRGRFDFAHTGGGRRKVDGVPRHGCRRMERVMEATRLLALVIESPHSTGETCESVRGETGSGDCAHCLTWNGSLFGHGTHSEIVNTGIPRLAVSAGGTGGLLGPGSRSLRRDELAGRPARLLQRVHCVQRYWRSACDERCCASQVRSIGIATYNRRAFAKIVRGIFHDWARPSVQVVCGLGEGTREENIPSCKI